MKKIALEEAFVVPGLGDIVPEHAIHPAFQRNYAKLVDLTGERLKEMDATDTEVSVLGFSAPGIQGVDDAAAAPRLAREWNDYLANAIAGHPDRLKGYAALPMQDPEIAAEELRRAVKQLGFVGALLNGYDNAGRSQPRYYDAPEYVDFWRVVAELDVPVYLHPRSVPLDRVTTYSGYPELLSAAWGFHVETGEHVLRLILSGLFDKVPGLRMIIGHMGEMLLWWVWRLDRKISHEGRRDQSAAGRTRQHDVAHYLRSNFYITTSGYFENAAMQHTLSVVGPDRVLYSVDYPYESFREANDWFEALPLSEGDKRKIAYDNAAALLGFGSKAPVSRAARAAAR